MFIKEHELNVNLWFLWTYLEMVSILMMFTRAQREGNWDLHLYSVTCMLPYFMHYDHLNYVRCGTVYFTKMHQLPVEVEREFKKGNFVVKRSTQKFNRGSWPESRTVEQNRETWRWDSGHNPDANSFRQMGTIIQSEVTHCCWNERAVSSWICWWHQLQWRISQQAKEGHCTQRRTLQQSSEVCCILTKYQWSTTKHSHKDLATHQIDSSLV